jgi:hypothetical protein
MRAACQMKSQSSKSSSAFLPNCRFGILMLCLLVFVLALTAKLSLYVQSPPPSQVSPAASAKLWLNGEKMVVETVASDSRHAHQGSASECFLSRLFCILLFQAVRRSSGFLRQNRTPIPITPLLLCLRRFFRPPPTFAAFSHY